MTDKIGICQQSYAVYEGDHTGVRLQHVPILTPIRYFTGGNIPELKKILWLPELIFREDDFDPVTKIRRGRVYTGNGNQPTEWKVHDDSLTAIPLQPHGFGLARPIRLFTYQRENLFDLRNKSARELPSVILGDESHLTFWKIISIETNLFGTPVLCLRAKHSLGDTPELIENKVPEELLSPLTEALDKVEASVNRLSPAEVIDRCRDALSLVFGYQVGDRSKDLGDAIKAYLAPSTPGKTPATPDLRSHCGHAVRLLHAQAKPNVQHERGLRPPADADADLALSCLKTVLIEFGWAR